MPWSGSSYTRTNGDNTGATLWQQDKIDGDKITASRHDTADQDLADGINACVKKDGANITADLPMNSYKHTGVADATARTNYAKVSQIQDGSYLYAGSAGGSADALTGSVSPAITAYVTGQQFLIVATAANTTSTPTLNINGVGALIIKRSDRSAIVPGDIQNTGWYRVTTDGVNFFLLNPTPTWQSWVPTWGGFSVSPSNVIARYIVVGKTCTINLLPLNSGTSNATNLTFTLPVNALTTANYLWSVAAPQGIDNGVSVVPAIVTISASSPTLATVFKNSGNWTASGSKNPGSVMMSYEIA
jgi:hypothetical protein